MTEQETIVQIEMLLEAAHTKLIEAREMYDQASKLERELNPPIFNIGRLAGGLYDFLRSFARGAA